MSEQQVLDCTKNAYGCDGGWIENGLNYIKYNGMMRDSDYPYTASEGMCNHDYSKSVATITDVWDVNDAKIAISNGPFGVYVNAVGDFVSYAGGIFNGYCGTRDHAVIIAGWGNENGIDYWIIRNSWGTKWGENGYIRVKIGGNCNLEWSSFPVVA
jgi:C1A family cysteine protease